ncbi:hypothetical protein GCM10012278_23870 [Nonomuraea glycinis]|uniref:Uncharacterized protein n=1 Tax=Nonomuraea glycinis TaxID=2047744 RepID=A0A918E550_9ACTN|nr:hypothetical protein GCM10012278_23870 [Nonomuraea glycinis]
MSPMTLSSGTSKDSHASTAPARGLPLPAFRETSRAGAGAFYLCNWHAERRRRGEPALKRWRMGLESQVA